MKKLNLTPARLSTMQSLAYNKAGRELAEAHEILGNVQTGRGPESWQRTVLLHEVFNHLQFCAECLLDINANDIGQATRDRLRGMCRE